ncbi:hypothetical protein KYK31_22745 [Hymenobacter norwichensis]|nr:hypothetical protein [Hymenobacter norwichensis]
MGVLNRLFFVEDENDKIPFAESQLTSVQFTNKTNKLKRLWFEPTCVEVELDAETEYMLVSKDNTYAIDFENDVVVVFQQYTFAMQLYKRAISERRNEAKDWVLDVDYS